MNLFKIENLSVTGWDRRRQATKELVNGVSLEIGAHEIFGLVGESGSGKTMTALAALGLLPPGCVMTAGKIFWQGRPADASLRGRSVGLVFQDPYAAFNPVITVGRHIAEVLAIQKIEKSEIRDKIIELLAQVHISEPEKVLNRYPFELSGGQLQRSALAMALAAGPRLLITDEPTTALDVVTQFKIIKLLEELKDKFQMSILFISHDLALVRRLSGRVAVMNRGRIMETGSSAEIFENPKADYTRKLIGSIPVLRRFSH